MSVWSHIAGKVRITLEMMATDDLQWQRGATPYAPYVGVLHVQRAADPYQDDRNAYIAPATATLKSPDTSPDLETGDRIKTGTGDVWIVIGPADRQVIGQNIYSLKADTVLKGRPNRQGAP